MTKNPKILSIVLAGGEGTRLMPLTRDRAKPAVPFGGVYRLIDFQLSNLVNSGYRQVVVLTQYKSHSLDRHISQVWRFSPLLGSYVSPVPAQQRLGKHWYLGSADAIYQTINIIEDVQPDIVVIVGACLLQALTFTPLGLDVYGNKGWLNLGFTTIQPAEFMKFAICIWLPSSLHACSKMYHKKGIKAYAAPLVLYAIGVALVMGGKDLGTAMILVSIGGVAFLIVGFPGKWMGIGVLGAVVMVGALAISSPNRMRRILATYGDCSAADAQSVCYQSIHAKYAIASGGFLGLGIGNSREKWNYLPAAHNDFIFAIIGEETGFVGCAIVLLFFAILAWCMIVIALQVTDRYVAMVLMCVTIWIVGQAMVNIGVVVGVFPVLGVPMPFVSAGGSSMIMCLTAAGLVVGLMRSQPQIKQSRQSA